MEDPWGSPWATPDTESNSQYAPTEANPEPPPPAFFTTTPNNLNLPSSQSAWLEDDSFGDWASPESAQSVSATWGTLALGNATLSDAGQLTPKYEAKRKQSIPRWPSSRSTSPGQRSRALSKKLSSDHLTHDPWSSENSLNDVRHEVAGPLTEIQRLPALPTGLELSPHKRLPPASEVSTTIQSPRPAIAISIRHDSSSGDHADDRPTPPYSHVEPAGSTTASTSDGDGPHDSTREGSPITPVEEGEPGSTGERGSSKVHQLVEMYDGIARKSNNPPELVPPPKRSTSQSPIAIEFSQSADIKATDLKSSKEAVGERHFTSSSPDRIDARNATRQDKTTLNGEYIEAHVMPKGLQAEHQVPRNYADDHLPGNDHSEMLSTKVANHEPFKVDLEQVESLFAFSASNVTGADVEVPDQVIVDSFESVSERRMWYRLSRYESLRRYDTGNDDNYVRITWVSSTVRSDALKTVRRWMEEDSIGQRPFRTGVAKGVGGHGFGWDKASTQVDLENFFSRRHLKKNDTLATPQRSSMIGQSPGPAILVNESRPVSLPPLAVNLNTWHDQAGLGWTTGRDKLQDGTRETPPMNRASSDDRGCRDHESSPNQKSSEHTSSPIPDGLAIRTNLPLANTQEDEDDEWGEMVTPSVDNFPKIAGSEIHAQAAPVSKPDDWGFGKWVDNEATNAQAVTPQTPILPAIMQQIPQTVEDVAAPGSSSKSDYLSNELTVDQFVRNLPDLSYMLR
ncbi:hypothetical protein BN1723_014448 [Verticillium longisporum]|uniref:Uncharacterized protein n=1 Tax=Verticillium longisporum TaxID=100787 RepID=A0A0G4M9Y1_VERLO|nr:hypothetical protein BN1708_012686 [Verticillium longisporum]CRK31092.1 hypothetical protein BN1723_014448 [Verticillium longisporum]